MKKDRAAPFSWRRAQPGRLRLNIGAILAALFLIISGVQYI